MEPIRRLWTAAAEWLTLRIRPAATDDNLGRRGENFAQAHLRKQGLKILARNYRCPAGEADLIALDTRGGTDTIVFVEVKCRREGQYVNPESAVNADKRRRLQRVAAYYLASRGAADIAVRFDIVAIVAPPGQPPQIRHLPGAF